MSYASRCSPKWKVQNMHAWKIAVQKLFRSRITVTQQRLTEKQQNQPSIRMCIGIIARDTCYTACSPEPLRRLHRSRCPSSALALHRRLGPPDHGHGPVRRHVLEHGRLVGRLLQRDGLLGGRYVYETAPTPPDAPHSATQGIHCWNACVFMAWFMW